MSVWSESLELSRISWGLARRCRRVVLETSRILSATKVRLEESQHLFHRMDRLLFTLEGVRRSPDAVACEWRQPGGFSADLQLNGGPEVLACGDSERNRESSSHSAVPNLVNWNKLRAG